MIGIIVSWSCIVAVLASTATLAAAETEGLDLARAIELALERNERAKIAGERQLAAEARVRRARSFFFPEILATGSYTRRANATVRTVDDGEPVTIQSRNALLGTVSFSMPIFDARSFPLYSQAANERDAARLEAREDRRRLAFEAADAFLITIGTEQVQAAAERRLGYAQGALQDARARFEAGLVGSNDVTRAELEAASAERTLADAHARRQTAYLELGNLLDTEVEPPLVVPEAVVDSAAAVMQPAETLVATARAQRLDIVASHERAEGLHAGAREPLLRALPVFDFFGNIRFTNEEGFSGRSHDWNLGIGGIWEIFDGGERYAERDERLALSTIADLDARALEREVDLQVRSARVALEHSQTATRAAENAARAAQKNAVETMALYRQGLMRALELADASAGQFEAEVALVGERLGLARAFLGLRASLGFDPLGRTP